MSKAYVRTLVDDEENQIYPQTVAKAVYMPNGTDTVGRVLGDMVDQNTDVEFDGNKVIKTLASGNVVTSTFNTDGSIVEVTRDSDDRVIQTKTTTIDENGDIHIVVS